MSLIISALGKCTPRETILYFIIFSWVQVLVFLFAPRVYTDAAPDMDSPPGFPFFRLIGVFETGLLLIYTSAYVMDDWLVYYMTVAGRVCVIPFTFVVIFVFGGPWSVSLGVVQDFFFSFWTLSRLRANDKSRPLKRPLQRSWDYSDAVPVWEWATRFVVFLAGAQSMRMSVELFLNPAGAHQFMDYSEFAPVYLGCRSLGFMLSLIAGYHVYLSWKRCSLLTYVAIGCNQYLVCNWFLRIVGNVVGSEHLERQLRQPPSYHAHYGLAILAFSSGLYCTSRPPSDRKLVNHQM